MRFQDVSNSEEGKCPRAHTIRTLSAYTYITKHLHRHTLWVFSVTDVQQIDKKKHVSLMENFSG